MVDQNKKDEKESAGLSQEGREKIEKIYKFARTNTMDTIAYVILFLGIVVLFINAIWGGLMIGIVGGFYFAKELLKRAYKINEFVEEEGLIRALILGGVLLGLAIKSFWIFVGLAIGVGIGKLFNRI